MAVPLFEHFLVIGIPIDIAMKEADKISKANTMSSRILQRLGSFLSGNNIDSSITQNNNNYNNPRATIQKSSSLNDGSGESNRQSTLRFSSILTPSSNSSNDLVSAATATGSEGKGYCKGYCNIAI